MVLREPELVLGLGDGVMDVVGAMLGLPTGVVAVPLLCAFSVNCSCSFPIAFKFAG